MEEIVRQVMAAVEKSGLVEIEVSARHVHLTQSDFEILFGKGKTMTPKRDLSQPGQYLAAERVDIIGPKRKMRNVAVLGPVRKDTQVELSRSDCIALGVKAPLRESGDVAGSGQIRIEGPCGAIDIPQGVIVAHKHIHVPTEMAEKLGLHDKQRVSVEAITERPVVFKDVIIRVSDNFRFRMHVDFDEANGADISGFTLGKIIR